ncbi:MAG: restriction endonuclease subunit S [Ignavibacteria bacterium]|nr:restriction endonuclease subunit S [Ignavibacteria bacterium]
MNRYKKYKPSGIDWIGEIPSHWVVKKFKYLYKSNMGGTLLKEDLIDGGNIPVYSATESDILFGYVNKANTILKSGDLVIPARGNSIGHVKMVTEISTCTQTTIYSKRICKNFDNRFLLHYLKGLREILFQFDQTAIPQITVTQIKENPVILPTTEEQAAISSFLDDKTAQIDKLISNKQKLIELLKEERSAIINEAVRGEGKNWERKKLKYVAFIKYGLGQPPKQKDDGLPLIRATNVERGKINEKDLIYVDPDDVPYDRDPVLKENDIIVVRSGAYTADSAIIPEKFEGAITGYDMVVRVINDNPFYIAYCLLSDDVLINQLYLHRLRAAQPHLNKEELGETLINMPLLTEQNFIVQYIQTQTQRIDDTVSIIRKEIELMNEYRTALISEVITGKVKII